MRLKICERGMLEENTWMDFSAGDNPWNRARKTVISS